MVKGELLTWACWNHLEGRHCRRVCRQLFTLVIEIYCYTENFLFIIKEFTAIYLLFKHRYEVMDRIYMQSYIIEANLSPPNVGTLIFIITGYLAMLIYYLMLTLGCVRVLVGKDLRTLISSRPKITVNFAPADRHTKWWFDPRAVNLPMYLSHGYNSHDNAWQRIYICVELSLN